MYALYVGTFKVLKIHTCTHITINSKWCQVAFTGPQSEYRLHTPRPSILLPPLQHRVFSPPLAHSGAEIYQCGGTHYMCVCVHFYTLYRLAFLARDNHEDS